MIQLRQTYRGQAKQAAAAIWGSNAAHLRYKHIWVVDDDIDIHDYGAVDWAFAYRCNAAEDDIVFYPGTFGSALDPSTRLKYRNTALYGTGKWCRVLIDCTVNLDFEPEENYGGNRYPPMVRPEAAGLGPGRQALEGIRLQEIVRRSDFDPCGGSVAPLHGGSMPCARMMSRAAGEANEDTKACAARGFGAADTTATANAVAC